MSQVDQPAAPAAVLRGHRGEVSAVAWNLRRFDQVVTCGDDARVRVWSVDRDAVASRRPAAPLVKVSRPGGDGQAAMGLACTCLQTSEESRPHLEHAVKHCMRQPIAHA